MFKISDSERAKLEKLKQEMLKDPVQQQRQAEMELLEPIEYLLENKSFLHNLILTLMSKKCFVDGKVDFEKTVTDKDTYLAPHERDIIVRVIDKYGKEHGNKMLSLLFTIGKDMKVSANRWTVDEGYLKIKRSMWSKYHKK